MLKECTAREKKLRVDLDQAPAAQAQLIQEIGQIGAPVIHKVAQQLGEPVTSDVGDALESADDRLSGAALRALPRMGHAGAYTLAGRLEDPDPRTRERALSALATTTVPEPWYGEMLKLLADPDAEVRAAVTRLLPRMKPDKVIAPALDRLTALSEKNDDASRRTRSELVRALGQLGDPRAVPPLMAILTDRKEPIGLREVAAQSLVWLGASDLEKTLMEMVSDPDQAGVLGECRPEDLQMVVPDPVPLYVTALTRATDPQVIGSMTWKLGYLRDRRAVRPLIEVMNKYWGDNRTYYEGLSAQAALNLGEIGDPAAVPALLQLVARERWTQKSFPERHVLALGRIGDQRARALLLRLLRESQPGTWRERALAVALGDLGEPAAIPALKEWLKCGSHGDGPPPLCPGYNFTEDAAQALARIGAPAVPVLLEALDWRYEHTAEDRKSVV
jgi:HEAT repeat protein